MILAIDPGPVESAYAFIRDDYKPLDFGKILNADVCGIFRKGVYSTIVIEMIASYGMPVGAEVFETCVWIGRFMEAAGNSGKSVNRMLRKEVKLNLCNNGTAKDSNIIQALIDRFAFGQPNKGKGTKKSPGWFYGFSKDIWQAYALGVTWLDKDCNTSDGRYAIFRADGNLYGSWQSREPMHL